MTSPTTSADAAKMLRGLAAVIRKHGTCAPAALEEIADRLTQHAEAGAVAWMHEDGERVITAAQKQGAVSDGGASASSVAPYSQPLIHPAQPASQQGEAGVTVDLVIPEPGAIKTFAHPTGDKVRNDD